MSADEPYIAHLRFCYHPDLRDKFKSGTLGVEWAERYPALFDADDLRIYRTQCGENAAHFFEWLTAILLHEATGYLSLVEKYGAKSHPLKQPIWEKVAPAAVREVACERGAPDLFMYAADHSDWFFCEAKGERDVLSDAQHRCFRNLYRLSGKPVFVARLTKIAFGS